MINSKWTVGRSSPFVRANGQNYSSLFPNCCLPLFQSESLHNHSNEYQLCIFMKIKLIFIWMVSHQDSLWNRGKQQFGKLRLKIAVCPHKGLDLPTIHLELISDKMVYLGTSALLASFTFPSLWLKSLDSQRRRSIKARENSRNRCVSR